MTVLDRQELNIGLREDICCCTRVLGVPNYSYIILHTRFFVRYTFPWLGAVAQTAMYNYHFQRRLGCQNHYTDTWQHLDKRRRYCPTRTENRPSGPRAHH